MPRYDPQTPQEVVEATVAHLSGTLLRGLPYDRLGALMARDEYWLAMHSLNHAVLHKAPLATVLEVGRTVCQVVRELTQPRRAHGR